MSTFELLMLFLFSPTPLPLLLYCFCLRLLRDAARLLERAMLTPLLPYAAARGAPRRTLIYFRRHASSAAAAPRR